MSLQETTENNEVLNLVKVKTDELEKYLNEHFDRLVDKCKIWISNPNEESSLALRVLSQVLDHELSKKLFESLTEDERIYCKSLISEEVTGKAFFDSIIYIKQEVKKEVLSPSISLRPEFFNLLNSLKAKHLDYIFENHKDFLPCIIQFSPERNVVDFLNKSGNEKVFGILSDCLNDDFKVSEEIIDEMIPILEKLINKTKISTLNQRIISSLGDLGDQKLTSACLKLEQQGYKVEIVESLKQKPPLCLISKVPHEILKTILEEVRSEVFFKYVAIQEDCSFLLKAYGDEGSKKREMIDMDLSQLSENDLKQLKVQKESIERDFLLGFRQGLSRLNDSQFLEPVVNNWLDELKGA